MRFRITMPLCAAAILTAGCSAKDPPNPTPSYHLGVKDNSSTVNSWEPNREPIYTQPGVSSGKPVYLKPIASQRRFEPNDPLAEQVYATLQADASLPVKNLSASAKDGVVILIGTVPSRALKTRAESVARSVPGVRALRSRLVIVPGGSVSP